MKIINIVKPTDLVYMAIDGVAPLAKISQQRLRRFKSIKVKNMENYKNSGKIYVSNFGKIYQTFLSIFDLIKLFFIKSEEHLRKDEHATINEEINLNERI